MIELEPFTKDDIPTLIGWIDSPEFLLQWGGPAFTHPLDEAQLCQQIALTVGPKPSMLAYKAIDTKTEQVVGHIELIGIDRQNRSAYLARVLVGPPHLRGGGLGRRMVQGVLRVAFEELCLHRVELVVFDFNDGAIACYERAGFQKEGLLREARRIGDVYWSLLRMSILEHEWRSLQEDERWGGVGTAGAAVLSIIPNAGSSRAAVLSCSQSFGRRVFLQWDIPV